METKSPVLCSRGIHISGGGEAHRGARFFQGCNNSDAPPKTAQIANFHGEHSLMSLGQELAPHLPFLRRYARALTGSQAHGDAFVRATLKPSSRNLTNSRATSILALDFTRRSTRSGRPPISRKARSRAEVPRGRRHRPCPALAHYALVSAGAAADLARRLFIGRHGLSDWCEPAGRR